MALRSLIQLRGLFELMPGGSKSINPPDLQNTTPPSVETQVTLALGDNTIIVPSLADGVIIIFDPTSITVKKLKKVGGDTGIAVRSDGWCVLSFDPAAPLANFVISSDVADTGKITTLVFF